ncbi:mitochondrial 37S ribosomal protein bS21m [Calcarisporiella thermophila]|uniref:mitochondrial 37S ribosomal protein bS21m n=1 Tax=Calcarisporiella thermophila TaxID=911321 RepID=UPI003743EFD9
MLQLLGSLGGIARTTRPYLLTPTLSRFYSISSKPSPSTPAEKHTRKPIDTFGDILANVADSARRPAAPKRIDEHQWWEAAAQDSASTRKKGPYQGRSVEVYHENVLGSYGYLNAVLNRNNIRREVRANLYYEKPAQARRRLRQERNRKRFQDLVRKKVALIMQMKNRGM